jgi:light-regulated signal transduction histidine kinase (bacteriophytochrome)
MDAAFPGSSTRVVETIDLAAEIPATRGVNLLVLLDPSPAEAAQADEFTDTRRLPRWGVVVCTADSGFPAEVDVVPKENWRVAVVQVMLRMSWQKVQLRREIATLRGNLRSIGVRIAHDMRTPLGGILSAAETLRDTLSDIDPSGQVWTKSIIESEEELLAIVKHQSALTDELSRPVEAERFNMGEAFAGAMEWLEGKITLSGALILRPDAWPDIFGDRRKYERVWNLLINNSIKHGGAGRRIEAGWSKSEEKYSFWLSNNGPAVPEKKRVDLFRPFHRLHEPNSGRGLNLALMEQLVYCQGGESSYDTDLNGNPTFRFTVPVQSG